MDGGIYGKSINSRETDAKERVDALTSVEKQEQQSDFMNPL